ncbi:MAG: HDIG domain-containing protein [Bacillota bacterium]|nr:HDIG domain-containing protein [Bacillota bacterium]
MSAATSPGAPTRTPGPWTGLVTQLPRLIIGVLFAALVAAVVLYNYQPEGVDLRVGSIAPQDYAAPRTSYDKYMTARLKEQASASVAEVHRFDPNLSKTAASLFDALNSGVLSLIEDANLSREARMTAMASLLPGSPGPEVTGALADLSPEEWAGMIERLRAGVLGVISGALTSAESERARSALAQELQALKLKAALTTYLVRLGQEKIVPTMVLDTEETERLRTAAAAAVPQVTILKGQTIARRGDVLTEHQIALMGEFGMLLTHFDASTLAGSLLLTVILIGVATLYLRFYEGDVYKNHFHLLLLAVAVGLVLIITQLTRGISPYLAPVAFCTMVVASLLNPRLALFTGFVVAVAVGLISGTNLPLAIVGLVGGTVGVYSLIWVGQRSDFTRAGFAVGVANVLTILAFLLLGGVPLTGFEAWGQLGLGFLNGILSAVLAIGTLPFFESAFGILTAVRLLELANPNRPLLRRMLVEAPGTYHHSVVVGNLAEAAADTIGGNPLLARVGAYYHDIGKVVRPYFFIENQIGQDNPHDKISPSLSALIITSHVKDGVALAQEAKLPAKVTSFIRSHHGKSLVSYFYSRAAENGQSERIAEEDFRYDGPLPETREEAIVMLADSIEAAVRAMSDPDPGRIEALVRRIIRERLVSGQLEKCDLTLRDLDRIGETFVRVLLGIFHARIEYPRDSEGLIKQIRASGLAGAPGVDTGEKAYADTGGERPPGSDEPAPGSEQRA